MDVAMGCGYLEPVTRAANPLPVCAQAEPAPCGNPHAKLGICMSWAARPPAGAKAGLKHKLPGLGHSLWLPCLRACLSEVPGSCLGACMPAAELHAGYLQLRALCIRHVLCTRPGSACRLRAAHVAFLHLWHVGGLAHVQKTIDNEKPHASSCQRNILRAIAALHITCAVRRAHASALT